RRLIPGLIDAHAHLTGGGGEAGFASRVPPPPLSHYTRAGVTTVVGLLGTDDITRNTAALLAQVRGLEQQGITALCHTGGYHLPPTTLTGSVTGDIVHLDPVIGVGEIALSDHRSSQPTLEELLKLAAEAHLAGLLTGKAGIVHLHLGDGPRGLELVNRALDNSELPPRTFNPTHINRRRALFDQALALARRGCSVDITAFPPCHDPDEWEAAEALLRYLDDDLPPQRVTISSDCGGSLPRFDANGALLEMGVGQPGSLTGVLERLLADGQPLERILPAFTTNPARLLRLGSKGRIAAGMDADLVVLDHQHRVRDVMARGRWHLRQGHSRILGRFEQD
ncbi:MAG: beta-aspartyl-peptidase, partial [Candidatus Competibacteraceae bacterium]|nr:beta-aspartyl-peptidase [Candidatus Competibacteraceae bacterium]